MFNTLLYQPLLTALTFLTTLFSGSFGLAILALTFIIRTVLIPFSLPAMRSAEKIKAIQPKLNELKRKHSKDKKRLQQEQLNLYREHGINPAAGCLPTIIQFAVLIALYRVFIDFLNNGKLDSLNVNLHFLWLNLSQPDPYYILPILAGITQLLLSQMLMTGRERHSSDQLKKSSKSIKQELSQQNQESSQEMSEAIQQQMLYVMPVMTALIAIRLPSGLAVYWVTTTVFSIVQQYLISGSGGLALIWNKINPAKRSNE